jgi:hypothetical protein
VWNTSDARCVVSSLKNARGMCRRRSLSRHSSGQFSVGWGAQTALKAAAAAAGESDLANELREPCPAVARSGNSEAAGTAAADPRARLFPDAAAGNRAAPSIVGDEVSTVIAEKASTADSAVETLADPAQATGIAVQGQPAQGDDASTTSSRSVVMAASDTPHQAGRMEGTPLDTAADMDIDLCLPSHTPAVIYADKPAAVLVEAGQDVCSAKEDVQNANQGADHDMKMAAATSDAGSGKANWSEQSGLPLKSSRPARGVEDADDSPAGRKKPRNLPAAAESLGGAGSSALSSANASAAGPQAALGMGASRSARGDCSAAAASVQVGPAAGQSCAVPAKAAQQGVAAGSSDTGSAITSTAQDGHQSIDSASEAVADRAAAGAAAAGSAAYPGSITPAASAGLGDLSAVGCTSAEADLADTVAKATGESKGAETLALCGRSESPDIAAALAAMADSITVRPRKLRAAAAAAKTGRSATEQVAPVVDSACRPAESCESAVRAGAGRQLQSNEEQSSAAAGASANLMQSYLPTAAALRETGAPEGGAEIAALGDSMPALAGASAQAASIQDRTQAAEVAGVKGLSTALKAEEAGSMTQGSAGAADAEHMVGGSSSLPFFHVLLGSTLPSAQQAPAGPTAGEAVVGALSGKTEMSALACCGVREQEVSENSAQASCDGQDTQSPAHPAAPEDVSTDAALRAQLAGPPQGKGSTRSSRLVGVGSGGASLATPSEATEGSTTLDDTDKAAWASAPSADDKRMTALEATAVPAQAFAGPASISQEIDARAAERGASRSEPWELLSRPSSKEGQAHGSPFGLEKACTSQGSSTQAASNEEGHAAMASAVAARNSTGAHAAGEADDEQGDAEMVDAVSSQASLAVSLSSSSFASAEDALEAEAGGQARDIPEANAAEDAALQLPTSDGCASSAQLPGPANVAASDQVPKPGTAAAVAQLLRAGTGAAAQQQLPLGSAAMRGDVLQASSSEGGVCSSTAARNQVSRGNATTILASQKGRLNSPSSAAAGALQDEAVGSISSPPKWTFADAQGEHMPT